MSRIKKHKYEIAFILIVLVQVVYISCMFGINKQGFHSDELWNYGFANSTDGTHIYQSDLGHEAKNLDSWQSSENFRKYISVDKNEIFNYSSIYWNAECDYNPPLGYMMLHFICSFFPGTWSKWYCFALNMICFVVMQIYLYRLSTSITKNKLAGLFTILFFGFTMAALNICIFLRIYAPATMFGTMLMYYSHKLYDARNDEKIHYDLYIKAFVVTLAGCFTLHFFLPFAFIITAMYSLYYLFSKHYRQFFIYGFVMAGSVLVSILIFPATFEQMIGDGQNSLSYMSKKLSTNWQNRIYWSGLTNDLFGVHNSIWKTMTMTYILCIIGIVLFVTLPLCFVFRHEEWMKKIVLWLKIKLLDMFNDIKKCSYTLLVMMFTVTFVILIAAMKTSVGGMGIYCTRYIFIVYPIMAVFSTVLVWHMISYLLKNEKIKIVFSLIVCATFIILSNLLAPKAYYFKHYADGKKLTELENNSNCIIITDEIWTLTCYTCELFDTQNYFATDYEGAFNDLYESEKINLNDPLYLILDVTEMDKKESMTYMGQSVIINNELMKKYKSDDYLSYFESLDISTKTEYVGTDSVFGRMVKIYRLN